MKMNSAKPAMLLHKPMRNASDGEELYFQKGPRCELELAKLIEVDQRHFAIHDRILF